MNVMGARLCALLAERLNAVVPDGYSVTSISETVGMSTSEVLQVHSPQGWWAGVYVQELAEQDGDIGPRLFTAAYNALNAVQDMISEDLRWPWPSTVGRSKTYMAPPFAAIENEMLVLGYGERGEINVNIDGIPLEEITRED